MLHVIGTRSTQTNEPARCGAFLPLLNQIDGPVALLEVGASAGLCLYPDRYSYRYTAAGARHARSRTAATIAASEPPHLRRGDLVELLVSTASQVPAEATLVVFHSAVLTYLTAETRAEFVEQVMSLDAVWMSNEAAHVFPGVEAKLPPGTTSDGLSVLSRNGEPIALAGPHGQSLEGL